MSNNSNSKGQIFLGNLHYHANPEDIREAFSVQGIAVSDVRIPEGPDGKRKGFAFVDIDASEPLELREIISAVNGIEIYGRECRADVATPRPKREGGNRGGHDRRNEGSDRRANHRHKPGSRVRARDDHNEPSDW